MGSLEQKFSLHVPSSTQNLALIREFVTSVGAQAGLGEDDVAKLELAVDEACTNVIEHAHRGDITKDVVVRATFPDGRRLTGQYSLVGDGRIGIRGFEAGMDTLRMTELASLSYRRRHTGTGAIVGGIAGAGFGVFVALVASALCEGGDDCSGARPYLIAVPLFGSGGALVGAAIGSAFPKWKQVFP